MTTPNDPETMTIVLSSANDNRHDDFVQTFQLDESNLRGRIVRMGPVLKSLLDPHDYPLALQTLVIEAASIAVLLSSMLKYDGVFTLQAQGDGPVSFLVADITHEGAVRICARYRADDFALLPDDPPLIGLMGRGYLAFTVDQGTHAERYQGIVELQKDDLLSTVQHYFNQSEQIKTAVQLVVGRNDLGWLAGAIMLQHMPDSGPEGTAYFNASKMNEDWNRAQILLQTCSPAELLDRSVTANDLLYRLFHEEGVRVFTAQSLSKGCRCTDDRLRHILSTLTPDDLSHLTVEGAITMNCEFCNKDFRFDPASMEFNPDLPEEGGDDRNRE